MLSPTVSVGQFQFTEIAGELYSIVFAHLMNSEIGSRVGDILAICAGILLPFMHTIEMFSQVGYVNCAVITKLAFVDSFIMD